MDEVQGRVMFLKVAEERLAPGFILTIEGPASARLSGGDTSLSAAEYNPGNAR